MTSTTFPLGLNDSFLPSGVGDGCDVLVGRCHCSERYFFPVRSYCPECLEPMEVVPLSGRGHVYAFTTVRRRAPLGLPEPYAVGYIDLDDAPLRIFGLFAADAVEGLKTDIKVDLRVTALGHDNSGEPCLRPVFHLSGGQHG